MYVARTADNESVVTIEYKEFPTSGTRYDFEYNTHATMFGIISIPGSHWRINHWPMLRNSDRKASECLIFFPK